MPVSTSTLHRADQRFLTRTDWLTEYSSFSFGSHYDPGNVGFGRLTVHNEDILRPGCGFDTHAHADAEIITWMLSGALIHQDSSGQQGIVYPGLVQRTSAGTGIQHSERNDGYRTPDGYRVDPQGVRDPAHYIQMWVRPDRPGLEPSYAQQELDPDVLATDWVPVASGIERDPVITLNAAATLWATTAEPGETRTLPDGTGSQHVFVTCGGWDVETIGELDQSDAVRIGDSAPLRLTARTRASVLVWHM